MNLIDMYVTEVGQHLPAKNRADIEAEIRSLIDDTLDERSEAAGRPVDDEMVVDVLKEFGPPAKMAAQYQPARYLIGPALFPTFVMVMRIILTLIGVVALVSLGVEVSQPGVTLESGLEILGRNWVEFMTSALAALGNVVFVFAMLEWFNVTKGEKSKTWDPRTLRPSGQSEKINRIALTWSIALTLVALILFNLYPEWIGITYMKDGQWYRMPAPVLTDAFFNLLPFINVVWVLSIALNLALLQAGRWQPSTRWFQVGLKILNIIILIMMISGAPIVNLFPEGSPVTESLREVMPLAYNGIRALLVLVLVLEGFELAKILYPLVSKRQIPAITA